MVNTQRISAISKLARQLLTKKLLQQWQKTDRRDPFVPKIRSILLIVEQFFG